MKKTCLVLTLALTLCSLGAFADEASEPETPAADSETVEQAAPDSGAGDEAVGDKDIESNEENKTDADPNPDSGDKEISGELNDAPQDNENKTEDNSGSAAQPRPSRRPGNGDAPPLFDNTGAAKPKTQYTDSDGASHLIGTLHGQNGENYYDYSVKAEAAFNANIRNSDTVSKISSDGNVTLTYYEIDRTMNGEPINSMSWYAKLSGNLGDKWFVMSTFEVPHESSAAIENRATDNNSQIYIGFLPLCSFDGSSYDYLAEDRGRTVLGLRFDYSDSSKTYLTSVTLEADGAKAAVGFDDIDYSGAFLSGLIGYAFPEVNILSEMGL